MIALPLAVALLIDRRGPVWTLLAVNRTVDSTTPFTDVSALRLTITDSSTPIIAAIEPEANLLTVLSIQEPAIFALKVDVHLANVPGL